MPTIAYVRRQFAMTLSGARALFVFCLAPRGLHTEAGVEAAFLQLYKGWEGLLEDAVLAYMCGRLAHDGKSVASYVTAHSDQVARTLLYQLRPYVEWTKPDDVRDRVKCYFTAPNRLENALRPIMGQLREMATVRNAIAHASAVAEQKLYELAQRKIGGNPKVKRPADLLLMSDPSNKMQLMFDYYATVLETAAFEITG